MSAIQIKVCGLTSLADAEMIGALGVDAVGFVFWSRSPRVVDLKKAREIAAALPPFVARVGVFVDASRDDLARAADAAKLDILQLHGAESPELLHGLSRRAIKALRVGADFSPESVDRYVDCASGILLDSGTASTPGGSGVVFDWSMARKVRARVPRLILAGGLHAGNVAQAVAAVRPDAVDVSSGVEATPGRKDPAKVRAFVAAVRRIEKEDWK